ncbi:MAG: tetratricopeptide repeat protein, partial [Coleofasciculaceae cyanobacterium SM2_3_26]|nr:tetratricopeptide repeat protein [Coleofasciculaceae cyanobacterium SM2_3_26]
MVVSKELILQQLRRIAISLVTGFVFWLGLFFCPNIFLHGRSHPLHISPKTLHKNSAQPDAFQQGINALKQGDYPTAIEAFTHAIQRSEHVTAAYGDRCLAHLQLEAFHEAIADCTQAIERNANTSDNNTTQNAEAYLNRGLAWYRLGEFPAAIADYRQALQLHPHDGRTHYNLGLAHFALEAYAEAIAHYDRA